MLYTIYQVCRVLCFLYYILCIAYSIFQIIDCMLCTTCCVLHISYFTLCLRGGELSRAASRVSRTALPLRWLSRLATEEPCCRTMMTHLLSPARHLKRVNRNEQLPLQANPARASAQLQLGCQRAKLWQTQHSLAELALKPCRRLAEGLHPAQSSWSDHDGIGNGQRGER